MKVRLALSPLCTMPRRLGITRDVSLLYDSSKKAGRLVDSELASAAAREAMMPFKVRVAASRMREGEGPWSEAATLSSRSPSMSITLSHMESWLLDETNMKRRMTALTACWRTSMLASRSSKASISLTSFSSLSSTKPARVAVLLSSIVTRSRSAISL